MKHVLTGAAVVLILSGCGRGPSPQSVGLDVGTPPADPVLQSYVYTKGGSDQRVYAPFAASSVIYPDLETGTCSVTGTAEVKLEGTLDPANVDHIDVTGALSASTTISGTSFISILCLLKGSTYLVLKAVNAQGKANETPLSLSLSIIPTLTTIGFGHPRYPNPGFRTGSGSAKKSSLAGNGIVSARQIAISDAGKQTIQSTGNTTLTMEIGFANTVSRISP